MMTCAKDPSPSVADWIETAAMPLMGVEPRRGYNDLEPLRRVIGEAQIVSLGEATHGTREFRKLKHRLLEFCVAELGFTMLGIEAPFPESLAVNAYVVDGIGRAEDALAGMRYWIWDTEEVLDAIEWMRCWNATIARKVKFYGFVTDFPAVAAHQLVAFLARVAPDLAAECQTRFAPLTSDFTARLFGQISEARRDEVFSCLAKVQSAFEMQRQQWSAATSAVDWHLGRLQATVLDQAARFEIDRGCASHDRVMAENVCALMEAEGPGTKAMLWSHNDHASRTSSLDWNSMGAYLHEKFGRSQVVVGCAFGRGSFRARTYPSGVVENHSVLAADPATFDCVLANSGPPLYALDLSDAPREAAIAAWLSTGISMRKIGGIYAFPPEHEIGVTYANTIRPCEAFDVVLFVAEATAARPNRPDVLGSDPASLPQPTNLELLGGSVPASWQTRGTSRKLPHKIVASSVPSPQRRRTVCVSRSASWLWGDGQLFQRISAEAWRGQRVRFTASFRTSGGDADGGALLFLKFLPQRNKGEADVFLGSSTVTSHEYPVRSSKWARLTVEGRVPDTAGSFEIGLVGTGNMCVWFGDLEFASGEDPPC